MKKFLTMIVIASLSCAVNAAEKKKTKSKSYPVIEKAAAIGPEIRANNKLLRALVGTVKKAGYRCDSISAIEPFTYTFGYTMVCNQHKYEYDLRGQMPDFIVSIN